VANALVLDRLGWEQLVLGQFAILVFVQLLE
jgi:hypothetical protein